MNNLINKIVAQFPKLNHAYYGKEFHMLYGLLWETNSVSDTIEKEILFIEHKRLKEKLFFDDEDSISPVLFVKLYSTIAYILAKEHCFTGRSFDVAEKLSEIFLEFLDGGFLSTVDRRRMRKEISETQLDFTYASGHDRFSSLRMVPCIKRMNDAIEFTLKTELKDVVRRVYESLPDYHIKGYSIDVSNPIFIKHDGQEYLLFQVTRSSLHGEPMDSNSAVIYSIENDKLIEENSDLYQDLIKT